MIVVAASVGLIGTRVFRAVKAKTLFGAGKIDYEGKPYKKSLIPGSLLFGIGWGLAGACPGTALTMLGEGKLGALFTIAGIVLGTYFYGLQMSRSNS